MSQNQENKNQNEIQLLPNQRICSNPSNFEKCLKIVNHISKLQCDAAKRQNKLCRNCSRLLRKKYHNIKILLEDTFESFYWIGFLLADGTFTKKGEMRCQLAIKDIDHLKRLSKFIGYENTIHLDNKDNPTNCLISVRDEIVIKQIVDKFNIHHLKTYNPPSDNIFTDMKLEYLKSLIVGFIDGDGSISKKKSDKNKYVHIGIVCHKTWYNTFVCISKLLGDSWYPYINKETSYLKNMTFKDIRNLKLFAIQRNLPIMNRKWDNIDVNHISRKEIAFDRRNILYNMINCGMTIDKIALEMKIHPHRIVNDLNNFLKYFNHEIKK